MFEVLEPRVIKVFKREEENKQAPKVRGKKRSKFCCFSFDLFWLSQYVEDEDFEDFDDAPSKSVSYSAKPKKEKEKVRFKCCFFFFFLYFFFFLQQPKLKQSRAARQDEQLDLMINPGRLRFNV
jgi:hypothetical protein